MNDFTDVLNVKIDEIVYENMLVQSHQDVNASITLFDILADVIHLTLKLPGPYVGMGGSLTVTVA